MKIEHFSSSNFNNPNYVNYLSRGKAKDCLIKGNDETSIGLDTNDLPIINRGSLNRVINRQEKVKIKLPHLPKSVTINKVQMIKDNGYENSHNLQ